MHLKTAILFLLLFAVSPLHADVTLRYKTEIKLSLSLPSTMQSINPVDTALPEEMTLEYKDGKAVTSQGGIISITDFAKQELTILDNQGKRFSTMPFAQFADAVMAATPQLPGPAAAALAGLKTHTESKATGRSATIQGIEADEREFDINVDPPEMPGIPGVPGPMIRMIMHIWIAKPGEALRVPAIREVSGYSQFANLTMNPMGSLEKILRQMSLDEGIANLIRDLHSTGSSVVLRTRVEMFMPMLDALLKQMPAGASPFGADFDPSAPLMTMNQELASISTEGVTDAIFRIPDGYQPAPVADILKDLMSKPQATHPVPPRQ